MSLPSELVAVIGSEAVPEIVGGYHLDEQVLAARRSVLWAMARTCRVWRGAVESELYRIVVVWSDDSVRHLIDSLDSCTAALVSTLVLTRDDLDAELVRRLFDVCDKLYELHVVTLAVLPCRTRGSEMVTIPESLRSIVVDRISRLEDVMRLSTAATSRHLVSLCFRGREAMVEDVRATGPLWSRTIAGPDRMPFFVASIDLDFSSTDGHGSSLPAVSMMLGMMRKLRHVTIRRTYDEHSHGSQLMAVMRALVVARQSLASITIVDPFHPVGEHILHFMGFLAWPSLRRLVIISGPSDLVEHPAEDFSRLARQLEARCAESPYEQWRGSIDLRLRRKAGDCFGDEDRPRDRDERGWADSVVQLRAFAQRRAIELEIVAPPNYVEQHRQLFKAALAAVNSAIAAATAA